MLLGGGTGIDGDGKRMVRGLTGIDGMPRHAKACKGMPRYAKPWHGMPRHAMACQGMPCHALACLGMAYCIHFVINFIIFYSFVELLKFEFLNVCMTNPGSS